MSRSVKFYLLPWLVIRELRAALVRDQKILVRKSCRLMDQFAHVKRLQTENARLQSELSALAITRDPKTGRIVKRVG